MIQSQTQASDEAMMRRAIALSITSGQRGEYPYAAVIARNGAFVCESINRVATDHDVTRHAEVVAISEAQKILHTTSLDDCTIYVNAEPCALCCYGIRESRIGRVLYGLRSPLMGGHTRWNILADPVLSDRMPEVFAPPPEITAGYLSDECEDALATHQRLVWNFITSRGIFEGHARNKHSNGLWQRTAAFVRKTFFDRFGRR
jgi:tRNA(adenine34) deaminase